MMEEQLFPVLDLLRDSNLEAYFDSLSYRGTAGDKRNDPLYFDESALAAYRDYDDQDIKPFQMGKRDSSYAQCSYPSTWPTTQYHYQPSPARTGPFTPDVRFQNLKPFYEKVQCRKNKHSKQRLSGATVNMVAIMDAQIQHIEVYVERCPKAAVLCGDQNGQVPLKPKMESLLFTEGGYPAMQHFSIDLDSVYLSPKGAPVYKLSTVDSDRRNRFRLVTYLIFNDGTRSKPFYSNSFLLRSKRSQRNSPY